jgi:hypothetical protein
MNDPTITFFMIVTEARRLGQRCLFPEGSP